MNVVYLLALLGSCCFAYGAVLPSGLARTRNSALSKQGHRVARQTDPSAMMQMWMQMLLMGGDDFEMDFDMDDMMEDIMGEDGMMLLPGMNPFLPGGIMPNGQGLMPGMANPFLPTSLFPFPNFPNVPRDINECSSPNLHTCPPNSKCKNTPTGYECECLDGFMKNGSKCEDKNECLEKNKCHVNAICENTVGKFTCRCADGFSGDGKTMCTDIDECLAGTHSCSDNFQCINVMGDYVCVCKDGYVVSNSGTECEDVNECATNSDNCSPYAICLNNIGSFTCTCAENFVGNGITCSPVSTVAPQ